MSCDVHSLINRNVIPTPIEHQNQHLCKMIRLTSNMQRTGDKIEYY